MRIFDQTPSATCISDDPQNVPLGAPSEAVSLPFDAAVQLLWPWSNSPAQETIRYPGRWALIRATFGHRASVSAIKAWRYGHRVPPVWAKDLLANLLEQDAAKRLEAARLLRQKKKGAD